MLQDLQSSLRAAEADVRWVAVPSIHLTLKFLGELDPAVLPRMTESLRAASLSEAGFSLRVHGLGAFPNLSSPRVVWCAVDGDMARLTAIQERVERTCAGFGFAPEERAFHPHLTLGRVQGKRNLQRLVDSIKHGSELESTFAVDHYNIYKSTLTPRGAIYDILETIPI